MDQQSVRQSLERLRAALDSGAPLDDQIKADLASLDMDIRRALEGDVARVESGLTERVREISVRFAERHPTAAAVLRELGTLLEGIGA
ncbi:DUF4404 family protein [Thiomonas sp. FB-Cd]|uniref:DUF4404 family protein n=1 Tax=Thiomonas sp. FB-Cd TaxID=1158292 RepID=UPI0004DF8B58|nr:DUF4404 family protein [Thiomonas sp. FB-Cd]